MIIPLMVTSMTPDLKVIKEIFVFIKHSKLKSINFYERILFCTTYAIAESSRHQFELSISIFSRACHFSLWSSLFVSRSSFPFSSLSRSICLCVEFKAHCMVLVNSASFRNSKVGATEAGSLYGLMSFF